jgi:hypothetical protein
VWGVPGDRHSYHNGGEIMDWGTKRKVRSEITTRLKPGDTKDEIFYSMTSMYGPDPIIKRILSDIPSRTVQEQLKSINNLLLSVLICIALIKGYFLILGLTQKTASAFLLFTTLVIQILLIWMVIRFTRTGYLAVGIYDLIQVFEYLEGFKSTISIVQTFCVTVAILLTVTLGLSLYLYIKSNEKWLSPNKANSADAKSRAAD